MWLREGYCAILGCYIIKLSVIMSSATQLGQPGRLNIVEASELFKPLAIINKGYKIETAQSYLRAIKQFIQANRFLIYADQLDLATVKAYQSELLSLRRKSSTIHVKTEALKAFISFLEGEGYIREPFSQQIVLPIRNRTSHQIGLSREQFDRLLQKASGNPRDKAILQILYQTGMKVSELLSLTLSDVSPMDDGGCSLSFRRTKGKRVEIETACLDPGGFKALTAYLLIRPISFKPPLFLNKYGMPISARAVEMMVKRYAIESSLPWVNTRTIRSTRRLYQE